MNKRGVHSPSSLYGPLGRLSRLKELCDVPVDRLRLLPLGNVARLGNDDQPGLRNHGLEVPADLWRKETILFAPQDQRGLPDLCQSRGKLLFPQGQAIA